MKRILFVVVVFLLAGALYAQQARTGNHPSSSQTKQDAQQYSTQAKSRSSQFEADLAELLARNVSNKDLETFNRIKSEIEELESKIGEEKNKIITDLDKGHVATTTSLNRVDRLIKQHQTKIKELDTFISGT